jgi:hypothetical protein
MIDNGQGDQMGHFIDIWREGERVIETQAKTYYSMINPAGAANMQLSVSRILKPINVLSISGTDDRTQREFGRTVYNLIPKIAKSKMLAVKGTHLSICDNKEIILNWINTL